MAVKVAFGNSGNTAKEDGLGNLLVNLPGNAVRAQASNGDSLNCSDTGALRVSAGELIFYDQVEGSALNTNLWAPSNDTLTIAIANEYITLNSANVTTASKYALIQSIKQFPMYSLMPLVIDLNALPTVLPQAGLTMELGIGLVSGVSAPTDGCFFRWNPQGQFVAVISNGGSETSSAALTGTITDSSGNSVTLPPAVNSTHIFHIEVVENSVEFSVDDAIVSTLNVPPAQAFPTNNGHLPLFCRYYNGATPPAQAGQLSLGQAVVTQDDVNQNKPWCESLAGLGRGIYQNQINTFGQTANHANSTVPATATLSNTTAGYATLGGKFLFAAPAGAETDYALFAFQNPSPFQMYVTDLAISCINTGAAVGITASLLEWAVGVNSSAVSLATADGVGTWAPRRIPVGSQAFAALSGIGIPQNDIVRHFSVPLIVDAGRYLHLILRVPIGLATGSQVFRGMAEFTGYYE